MNQEYPKLRVDVVGGRNVFPKVTCEECDRFPTQHRCLTEVQSDGYLLDGRLVCGIAVCSICISLFGTEGIYKCAEHSEKAEAQMEKESGESAAIRANGKDNGKGWVTRDNKKFVIDLGKGSQRPVEEKMKKERGAEYSTTEILLLSKAWISASEDAIIGINQKINTFWDSVHQRYNKFKLQQEEYMTREKEKDRFRQINLRNAVGNRGAFLDEENDGDIRVDAVTLPTRNVGSLQQKWSKKVQPLIFKFIGVTKRFPKRSGEDREEYYNRIHLIFLKENPTEKSFDIYRPSWEYLVDKPKFAVACEAPSSTSRKRDVISIDDNEGSDIDAGVKIRPLGRNATKRKLEAQKIMESVTNKIEASQGATATSTILAGALQEIAKCVGSAMSSWQMQFAVRNASVDLQRQLCDAIVKRQLEELHVADSSHTIASVPNQINISNNTSSTTSNSNDNNTDEESEVLDSCPRHRMN